MSIPPPLQDNSSYEQVEYIAASFPRVNPSRMGAVAYLFGMRPVPATNCRMLELGCGQGGTLLAMAQLYPNSQFHGIDLSKRQIENATRIAEQAGLKNVCFEQRNITDVSLEKDGMYDFIACHGVYSWVPKEVREHVLSVCGQQLSPQGVAYVSYNTLPGWSHLRAVRDMLIYHTQRYPDPQEKFAQSRKLIGFLRETAPGGTDAWLGKWLQHVDEFLSKSEPAYFLHEFLEDTNEPCFFHEFMNRSDVHNLQYVSESLVSQAFAANLGAQASKVIDLLKRSLVDGEQYMDFARNTQFRATLLARKDASFDRGFLPERLRQLLYITALRPVNSEKKNLIHNEVEEFVSVNGSKFNSRDSTVKAALHFLSRNPGEFLSLPAIHEGALGIMREENFTPPHTQEEAIKSLATLIGRFLAAGLSEPSTADLGEFLPVKELPEKPYTLPVVRSQAQANSFVLRHSLISQKISHEAATLLPWCDGSRTQDELFAIYVEKIRDGTIMKPVSVTQNAPDSLRAAFDDLLAQIVRGQLLWSANSTV